MSKKSNETDQSTELPPVLPRGAVDNTLPRSTAKQYPPNSVELLLQSAYKSTKPSKVVDSAAYETDLNVMVARGMGTASARPSFYVDESMFPDSYEDHYNLVLEAQDAFMDLPLEVREHFNNDPRELADALSDPSRLGELRDLGMIDKPNVSGKSSPTTGEAEPPQGGGSPEGDTSP